MVGYGMLYEGMATYLLRNPTPHVCWGMRPVVRACVFVRVEPQKFQVHRETLLILLKDLYVLF